MGRHLLLWVALSSVWGCQAEVETTCVAGDCSPYEPERIDTECYATCDLDEPSGRTGEYPCAVEVVIENCRRCHDPDGSAPFSLDTYEDSQQLYLGTVAYGRFESVIQSGFMPLEPPALTEEQQTTLLEDWACICAPPREAGVTCQ